MHNSIIINVRKHAEISKCGKYRYLLERMWAPFNYKPTLVVCMLNPSTADANQDDATIRWLIGWANKHNYGSIRVINLAAYRATSPKEMLSFYDPHGPENESYLLRYCSGKTVLCAWGNKGIKLPKYKNMIHAMRFANLKCLCITKKGNPIHPLRQSHSLELIEYNIC